MSKPNTTPYNLPADAVWFITGCSSGIGQALAAQIASHPTHRLVATARSTAALSSFLPDDDNDRVLKVALDVTSEAAVSAAISAALSRFGRIDVLVNNAGYGLFGDTEAMGDAEARRLVETNFWAVLSLSRHAVRVMRDENPKSSSDNGGKGRIGGVVLNVTSVGGFIAMPGAALYHAAKFAVEGVTESMAQEMKPEWNIHFCIIEPGAVRTNFATTSFEMGPSHPAYDAPDSAFRAIMGYMSSPEAQATWASPERAADAMYRVVADLGRRGRIPIRVPVGPDAWNGVKNECEKVLAELEEVKEVSYSTGNADEEDRLNQVLFGKA